MGIGTDSPAEELHIQGNSAVVALIESTGANDSRVRIKAPSDRISYLEFADDDADAGEIRYDHDNNYMGFHVNNNQERLRITGDGKVGIATNNPTEQLEIYNGASGNPGSESTFRMRSMNGHTMITLDARGTNASSYIYFTDSSATYNSFIQRSHSSNAAFAGLRYCYDGSASEAFRISESGGFDMGGAGYGTAGQVLKSNGNAPPTWSGGAQRILEVVASPCDGSTIATSNGNITFPNVTGPQDLSTSYANVQGSIISYQPPSGTQQVIYEFNMQVTNHDDAISIGHFKFYIDGSEVVYARRGISAEDVDVYVNFKYVINIGGSANANTGRIASWSSAKEMKMTAREYHSTNNAISLHETDHWDGGSGNMFSQPVLHITAIGI